MRVALGCLAVVLMCSSPVEAQPTTADAVDAFLAGDYVRAAEILTPIVAAWPRDDHVAEFFMATMYEGGLGVAMDATRACALYSRANSLGPLGSLAALLFHMVRTPMNDEQFMNCWRLAEIGFDHGFVPVTFSLEPGFWITLDLNGGAITHAGVETPADLGFVLPGAVLASLAHTELTVGGTPSMRRHFIELFVWLPGLQEKEGRVTRGWGLLWRVFEVLPAGLAEVTAHQVMQASGPRPPPVSAVEVERLARLRVNDGGDAEWAVLSGSDARAEVIETQAHKQARTDLARGREAADAKVDWKRVVDPARTPALKYSDGDGCGNALVYGWSADRTEAISVRVDTKRLQLSSTPRTFDLGGQQPDVEVAVQVYARPRQRMPFCTHHGEMGNPLETWTAQGGVVTIEPSPPGADRGSPHLYRITVRIVGAEFVSATGVRVRQREPLTLTAIVGSSQF
jgi:hypothetical protein